MLSYTLKEIYANEYLLDQNPSAVSAEAAKSVLAELKSLIVLVNDTLPEVYNPRDKRKLKIFRSRILRSLDRYKQAVAENNRRQYSDSYSLHTLGSLKHKGLYFGLESDPASDEFFVWVGNGPEDYEESKFTYAGDAVEWLMEKSEQYLYGEKPCALEK